MPSPGVRLAESPTGTDRAALLVVVLVFVAACARFRDFVIDDAGIFLRYAQHLWDHGELRFNVGEPAFGVTSVLWPVVLSPVVGLASWIGADPIGLARWASRACALASLPVLAKVLGAGSSRTTGLLGLLLLATQAPLVVFAGAFMETSLCVLLLSVFLLLATTPRPGALLVTAVLLGATRPDTVLITAPIAAWHLVARRRELRPASLLPAALTAAALLAFTWAQFRSFVPLPYLAKARPAVDTALVTAGTTRILGWLARQGLPAPAVLLAARAVGRGGGATSDGGFGLVAVAAAVLHLAFYASWGADVVMDDVGRYYLPGALVLLVASLRALGASPAPSARAQALVLGIGVAANVVALHRVATVDQNLGTKGEPLPADEVSHLMAEYLRIGRYLHDHYPPSTRMMVQDAGLVPFVAGFDRVLDSWSLNDPELVACLRSCLPEVVDRFDPDLVLPDLHAVGDRSTYRHVTGFGHLDLYERADLAAR